MPDTKPILDQVLDQFPDVRDKALTAALAAAGEVAYVWDFATGAINWNGAAEEFTRLGGMAALADATALIARLHPEDRRMRQDRVQDHLARATPFDCEYRIRGADGKFIWVHDRGAAPTADRMYGIWRFVTANKDAERRQERSSNYDQLTGFFNRKRFREALEFVLVSSLRSARAGAYLVVGVDKLSVVNDTYGNAVGDTVLNEVGRRIEHTMRASDVIGRVGSDRFGIVLSECPEENVAIAAERILTAVNREPIATEAGPVYATVSIGAASFPEQAKVAQEIMARADHAIVEAKRAGRDCFVAYSLSEEQRNKHRSDMSMGEQVQRALREGRLVFAYQPVVESVMRADDHQVDYYECLLRMIGEDGKPIEAAYFIPVIERLGFVRAIDRYVLERAVREAEEHPGHQLGFNISGLTATDRSWLRAVTRLLRDRPAIARQLVVEITETAALTDIEECSRFVATLRELGCRVAIDDFGVGFTSLRHLQALAVDTVKIDGSFVRDLATKTENQVFLRHLVGLAHGLGFTTVAEGVESEREAQILRREGVKLQQGHHFARPSIEAPWGK
jgi:diguanylate cyclase (GGDEF)-like protein